MKARILAVCAALALAVPALSACGTYHDTYHDARNTDRNIDRNIDRNTYHDRCTATCD